MYSVQKQNRIKKNKILDGIDFTLFDGFMMASKNKIFHIQNSDIREIKVMNKKLANPLVSRKVFKKYDQLISRLTDLLVEEDDDSGECPREVLNQIEKFRLEIKNKYRVFLQKKELEKMSKQLLLLQKEANKRLLEIQNSYLEYTSSNRRGK